jgi:hypothetical protein
MRKSRNPSANLEREVIVAVIVLYLIICAAMLGIHYWQPGGSATETSSTSPAHEAQAAKPVEPRP